MPDRVVTFNVGGKIYSTLESNVIRYKDSKLGRLCRDKKVVDPQGNLFVDGDGDLFKYILHFLRRSELNLPSDFKDFSRLAKEAEYYQIPELVERIDRRRQLETWECYMEVEYDFSIKKWQFSAHKGFLEKIPVLQDHYQKFNQGRPSDPCKNPKPETLLAFDTTNPIDKIELFFEISQLGFKLVAKSSSVIETHQESKKPIDKNGVTSAEPATKSPSDVDKQQSDRNDKYKYTIYRIDTWTFSRSALGPNKR